MSFFRGHCTGIDIYEDLVRVPYSCKCSKCGFEWIADNRQGDGCRWCGSRDVGVTRCPEGCAVVWNEKDTGWQSLMYGEAAEVPCDVVVETRGGSGNPAEVVRDWFSSKMGDWMCQHGDPTHWRPIGGTAIVRRER